MPVSTERGKVQQDQYTADAEEVALLASEPTPGTAWAALNRTDYGSYADQTLNAGTGWGAAVGATRTTNAEIAFPAATSSASGNVTHVAIRKAATEEYTYDALTTPRAVPNGSTPKFAAGDLTHTST